MSEISIEELRAKLGKREEDDPPTSLVELWRSLSPLEQAELAIELAPELDKRI